MLFYIFLFILCFVLCNDRLSMNIITIRAGDKVFHFSVGFSLFLIIILAIATCRSDNLGKDIFYFKYHFYNSDLLPQNIYEPGYEILKKLFRIYSNNFQLFMAFCSMLTLVPIYYVVKKENRDNIAISLFIITTSSLVQSFSILRGYLAIAFIFLAYRSLKNDDNKVSISKWSVLFAVIAFFSHYTSIVFVLAYFFSKRNLRNSFYIFFFAGSILLKSSFVKLIFAQLITMLNIGRYSGYITHETTGISTVYALLFGSAWLFYLKKKDSVIANDCKTQLIGDLIFCGFVISIGVEWFPGYARLLGSMLPFTALLIPKLIASLNDPTTKGIASFVVVIICFFYFMLNTGIDYKYSFFWS